MTTLSPGPLLMPGDPLPWFVATIPPGGPFAIERAGGAHALILVFGSAAIPGVADAIRLAGEHARLFDGEAAAFFAVGAEPADFDGGRLPPSRPHMNFMLDRGGAACAKLGAVVMKDGRPMLRPQWLLVDPALRVLARFDLAQAREAFLATARAVTAPPADLPAPVLVIPDVLEPDTCRALIDLYERVGGAESGFMREVDGKTVGVFDHRRKRRQDCQIEDEALRATLRSRLGRRVSPMIKRAFWFDVTRIERYIVACYDGETGGHFKAHRDNTTPATLHRRFAVTINLNGEFTGGDLTFPEFGARTYRAPPGGAVVFSCSVLHEATPVTAGRRYATLPFLYDDAGAEIRQANAGTIVSPPPPGVEPMAVAAA